MTILPVAALSPSELRHLGHNVLPAVRQDAHELGAVNRSLDLFGEQVDRLYRRRISSRPARPTRRRRAA